MTIACPGLGRSDGVLSNLFNFHPSFQANPVARTAPRAGQPGCDLYSWAAVLELLALLMHSPVCGDAAGISLAAGPPASPLGQQLATHVLQFAQCLAAMTGGGAERSDASTRAGMTADEARCWRHLVGILESQRMRAHLSQTASNGPEALQLQRSLAAMLRKVARGGAGSTGPLPDWLVPAASCAAAVLSILAPDEAQPAQEQCLSASLAGWAALEAVPALASICRGGEPPSPLFSKFNALLKGLGEASAAICFCVFPRLAQNQGCGGPHRNPSHSPASIAHLR